MYATFLNLPIKLFPCNAGRTIYVPGIARHWIAEHPVKTLNVAGSRESQHPGIYHQALTLLLTFFAGQN